MKNQITSLYIDKPLVSANIPAWVSKDCMNIIAHPLCYMINTFISENKFPSHLKKLLLNQFCKKRDTEDSFNYGPISITIALSKVLEKVQQQQMIDYLDKNRIFSSLQFASRKHFSTTDALRFATEKIRSENGANENVTAAYIDLSKEIDPKSHESLLKKLAAPHFTDEAAVSMIKSYIDERIKEVMVSTTD